MNEQYKNLYNISKAIILANQSANGAFIASPTFPTYHYCWMRDGSFIAYSMDLIGEHDSAWKFHEWSSQRLLENKDSVERGIIRVRSGLPLDSLSTLNTRYHLDGKAEEEGLWPNFQLDGFGTWLWSINEHILSTGKPIPTSWMQAAQIAADYLNSLWQLPCYDCWEEYPEVVHPSTLAAIYSGLKTFKSMGGEIRIEVLVEIYEKILLYSTKYGYFTKFIEDPAVDFNLISLAVPYQVFPIDDETIKTTVNEIQKTIGKYVGVHRYAKDSYYGGGEWILLTAWLGWYKIRLAKQTFGKEAAFLREEAIQHLEWITNRAGTGCSEGWLPEQVSEHLNFPEYLGLWEDRWGQSANPLLWSHAMFLILYKELFG